MWKHLSLEQLWPHLGQRAVLEPRSGFFLTASSRHTGTRPGPTYWCLCVMEAGRVCVILPIYMSLTKRSQCIFNLLFKPLLSEPVPQGLTELSCPERSPAS